MIEQLKVNEISYIVNSTTKHNEFLCASINHTPLISQLQQSPPNHHQVPRILTVIPSLVSGGLSRSHSFSLILVNSQQCLEHTGATHTPHTRQCRWQTTKWVQGSFCVVSSFCVQSRFVFVCVFCL